MKSLELLKSSLYNYIKAIYLTISYYFVKARIKLKIVKSNYLKFDTKFRTKDLIINLSKCCLNLSFKDINFTYIIIYVVMFFTHEKHIKPP